MKPSKERDSDCCGTSAEPKRGAHGLDAPWIVGTTPTDVGAIPRVTTSLTATDRVGACKARWGIDRMRYLVPPGLYALGNPTAEAEVFVTANYKMSFDRLRSQLAGRDGWILVLDTKGINVWCAAGKGTFSTEEIVARIGVTRLADVVSHRRLIVPQLGGPGVSAHEVRERSDFGVIYGPVRAEDLPAFLDAELEATPAMRRVTFPFRERVALIPMEVVGAAKPGLFVVACLFLLSGLGTDGYSTVRAVSIGLRSAALVLAAYLAGGALTPALLPWLPGRAFSVKGALAGLALAFLCMGAGWSLFFENVPATLAWFLLMPAAASFLAMNFTGASTYTSLSGVQREMRTAVPLQAGCAIVGLGFWLAARFI